MTSTHEGHLPTQTSFQISRTDTTGEVAVIYEEIRH